MTLFAIVILEILELQDIVEKRHAMVDENTNDVEVTNCYYCGRDIESAVPCGPTASGPCPCCGLTIITGQQITLGVNQTHNDEE